MSAQECPFEFVEMHKKAEKRRKKEEREVRKKAERLEEELKAYVAERMDVSDVVRALRKKRREVPEGYPTWRRSPYERAWSCRYEQVMYGRDIDRFDKSKIFKELEKKIQQYFESYCKVEVTYRATDATCCACFSGKYMVRLNVTLFLIKEEFDKFKALIGAGEEESDSYTEGSTSSY